MKWFVLSALAGLLGGALGAFAATRWLAGPEGRTPSASSDSVGLDDLREQLREIRAVLDRPRELAVAPTAVARSGAAAGPASGRKDDAAAPSGRASPELEAAIERAVAAGIESARKQDPAAFAPAKPEGKKHATLSEVARELALSSAQEDDIRRAYADSTDRFLKVMAEPETTPDALRRELEEAKGDVGKRTALTFRYIPKMLGKIGEVMAIQSERDQRIHKALGPDNVAKYEKYKVAEEDPFGLDGENVAVSVGAGGK